jgi:hypothetical protein
MTFAYGLYILNASYQAGDSSELLIETNFVSPHGITAADFTGEPCFVFTKYRYNLPFTVFAITDFPADILTSDKLTINITRDDESNFTFVVNNQLLFSAQDPSPPPTALNSEGYYFGVQSFGGGSWVDNIIVSVPTIEESTTTTTTTTTTEEANATGIITLLISSGILILLRRKKEI